MTRNLWFRLGSGLFLVALGIAGAMLGAVLRHRVVVPPAPVVTINFLEVDDGDCTLVRTPDGRSILVDTGGAADGSKVPTILKRMDVGQIDLLVLASPSDSAVGGVKSLIDAGLPIRSVWLNSVGDEGDAQREAVEQLNRHHVPIRIVHGNEQTQIGTSPMVFTVVWPPRHGDRSIKDNLVCRVDYGSESCLFLGPLEASSEPYIVSGAADQLRADVLQVTQHGDGEGTSLELLRRVQPEIAVISSTSKTPPAPAAVERLQAAGADIWRTDVQGTVTVTLSTNPNTPVVTGSRL